ncbi:FAR1 DNA-binding domain [Sesbania bispinosa]|nr:FAR1 DNA-binding domain [Sesbania bispinosa]
MDSHGTSWADQWDDGPDHVSGSNQSKKKSNNVLGKTKTVASTGVKKLKEGTSIGAVVHKGGELSSIQVCEKHWVDEGTIHFDDEDGAGQSEYTCVGMSINDLDDVRKIDMKSISCEEVSKCEFAEVELGYLFYCKYAMKKGFTVKKGKVVRNTRGEIVQQTLFCNREGKRQSINLKECEPRPKTRCGCFAFLSLRIYFNSGRWFVKDFNDDHNRDMLEEKYCRMMPSHRKMVESDVMVGFRKKDMYNKIDKQRRFQSSDAKSVLKYLRQMRKHDPLMSFIHMVDDENRLQHLFWSDGISQLNYQLFGDVLVFDATYGGISIGVRWWTNMVTKFHLEENNWMNDLLDKKHMWATAYITEQFFASLRTTSRCESLHGQLGEFIKSRYNLIEFVQHFQRCLCYMRYKEEEEDDFAWSQPCGTFTQLKGTKVAGKNGEMDGNLQDPVRVRTKGCVHSNTSASNKGRRKNKCSQCGGVGHNKKCCPKQCAAMGAASTLQLVELKMEVSLTSVSMWIWYQFGSPLTQQTQNYSEGMEHEDVEQPDGVAANFCITMNVTSIFYCGHNRSIGMLGQESVVVVTRSNYGGDFGIYCCHRWLSWTNII